MSKLDDAAQKMIANLEEKYGKSLAEWIEIGKATGIEKQRALLNHFKAEHGMTYGYANLVAGKTMDALKGGGSDNDDLVSNQYAKKADLKPIYDALVSAVSEFGSDVELAPKKAYVALRRGKQFGIIQPSTKTRVDVGINLKGAEPTERLEASGSFNSMVSHRVRVADVAQVDEELVAWLKEAYEAA